MSISHEHLKNWLQGIADLSAAVNQSISLAELLDLVAETACQLTGIDVSAILMPDTLQQVLVIEGSHGLSQDYIEAVNTHHPITLTKDTLQAPSSRAFLTCEPVQVTQTGSDPTFEPWGRLAGAQYFTSMVSVPLVVSGEALGTLNLYTWREYMFTREELDLLNTLANQAGIAIATSRLRTVEARTIEDLRRLNNSIEHQHALLQQSDKVHQHFTRVVLNEGGARGVAEALGELLDRPVVVDDPSGTEIASASHRGPKPDIPSPEVQRQEGMRAWFKEATVSGHPYAVPVWAEREDSESRIMTPVGLGNEVVARIWLPGSVSELEALDRRALEHAGTVLALEQLRTRAAMDAEWRISGELVTELVTGNPATLPSVGIRAQNMGHDLERTHVVLVAKPDPGSRRADSRLLTAVRSVAAAQGGRPLIASIREHIVALWPTARGDVSPATLAGRIRETFERTSGVGSASVSISPECKDLTDYPRAFRISRGALDLAHLRGFVAHTVSLNDLGAYGLLLQLDHIEELVNFADSFLNRLREHDHRRGTSLSTTLASFLRNNRSTADTAAELYVHPNTVGLRIRRAEELLGVSVSDTTMIVQLGLAFMVDEVVQLSEA